MRFNTHPALVKYHLWWLDLVSKVGPEQAQLIADYRWYVEGLDELDGAPLRFEEWITEREREAQADHHARASKQQICSSIRPHLRIVGNIAWRYRWRGDV